VECVGFFDCLNAYDNAYISLGPCHWILGFGAGATVGEGELPAYFAYLAETEPAAFDAALGFFGIRADKTWGGNGGALFNSSQRKYTAWLQQQGPDGTYSAVPATAAVADFFRTWPWFYRFQMAGRTVSAFRARMWDMARLRIRDIRATPWPPAAGVPDVPDGIGGTPPANLGDVFTSELATTLLLRWHVRFPTDVSNHGVAGTALVNALSRAILTVPIPDPSTWNDANEQALIAALMSVANSGGNQDLINTLTQVQNWPAWATGPNPRGFQLDPSIGGLNDLRGSFQFADAGLPAPPA
jgi:hypothetical protein